MVRIPLCLSGNFIYAMRQVCSITTPDDDSHGRCEITPTEKKNHDAIKPQFHGKLCAESTTYVTNELADTAMSVLQK
ncbi:hypothetical protein SUGI_0607140 [Cryptomeria japonica]|nr:hypothetical protein SUGI_0607140 [Cryptomeria japonica]